jgi:hypothetical protein
MRMVTHYGIERDDVVEVAARIVRCLNGPDPF